MNHIEKIENDLVKKEEKLEKKIKNESWGEDLDDENEIKMKPLIPHFSNPFHFFDSFHDKWHDIKKKYFKG